MSLDCRRLHTLPNEIPDSIRREKDRLQAAYNADSLNRFRRVLVQTDRVFKHSRAGSTGRYSPVHFFRGSFDLPAARCSGRPPRFREASRGGFRPGGGPIDYATVVSMHIRYPSVSTR